MSLDVENSTVPFVDPSESIEKQANGLVEVLLGWVFRLGGFVLNCIIWDALHRLQNPPATLLWIKHTAFWCNFFLALGITLGATEFLLSLDLTNLSRLSCKGFKFFDMFLAFTPNSLALGVYMDGPLFLSYPAWHHNQNWKRMILKCSACLAVLNFLCCLPLIAVNDFRNGSCEVISQTGMFSMYTLMISLFSVLLTGSSIVFVLSLRHYRKKRSDSVRDKVEFRSSKKANKEDPSAGNTNISTNASGTENRHGTKNNLFSDEDMNAIKFLVSVSIWSAIYGLLFVIVFYAIEIVNERFGKGINFWAYYALYQEFTAGINFFMYVFSREKPRNAILERYSGFIKKR